MNIQPKHEKFLFSQEKYNNIKYNLFNLYIELTRRKEETLTGKEGKRKQKNAQVWGLAPWAASACRSSSTSFSNFIFFLISDNSSSSESPTLQKIFKPGRASKSSIRYCDAHPVSKPSCKPSGQTDDTGGLFLWLEACTGQSTAYGAARMGTPTMRVFFS